MSVVARLDEARAARQQKTLIAFNAATLRLGGKTIIENLDLEVRPGEFLCIVGASGCGKTTALRLAAGHQRRRDLQRRAHHRAAPRGRDRVPGLR
jgi:NitT/TauT family transport system ATP-binding protein